MVVARVHGDVGAAPLVTHQDVLGGQVVDGLAQGADRHAETLGQVLFRGDRFALLPLALRQCGKHGLLDLLVQGTAQGHSR
ncbi:hypothetical protein D3C72_1511960 [compost metagenome]